MTRVGSASLSNVSSVDAASLLELFDETAHAVSGALAAMTPDERAGPGGRPTQYALDLVADAAALRVLEKAPVAVLSEESGRGGDESAAVTVVIDPVDGSTNCSRGVPYWSISLAAVDDDGLSAALVRNQVTGESFTAVRGEGAQLDGASISPSQLEEARPALVTVVAEHLVQERPWAWSRSFGSAALELCEVAAGRMDGFVDAWGRLAPWDYLGGLLLCREAGATVIEHGGRDPVVTDPDERRQLVVAGTAALAKDLRRALPPTRGEGGN